MAAILAVAAALPRMAAAAVPSDPSGFTAYLSAAFAKAMPDWKVSVAGPLSLSLKGAEGSMSADLHSIYASCQNDASHCEQAIALRVRQMAQSFVDQAKPIDRATLRVIVRPETYVAYLRNAWKGKGDPVAVPLLGGLWVICVSDLPTAIRTVNPEELGPLGLTRDQAIALGRQNVEAALPSLKSRLPRLKAHGIGMITGDPYDSSRIALSDSWAPLVKRMKGRLLVAVPAADTVLYTKDSGAASVDALATAARDVAQKAQRPLTNAVFRWTKDGWELALPGDKIG